MDSMSSGEWGYRVGGLAAVFAGVARLSIVIAFTLTGLGAAGDRAYGSFSGLTFVPSAGLVVVVLALYTILAERLGRSGRLGLLVAALGLILTAVGQLGGEWLAFPRSGNFLIAPGTLVFMAGLIAFSIGARNTSVPSKYATLGYLIALLPVVYFPLVAAIEGMRSGRFSPALHDNYFTANYVLGALLWIALGVILLRDAGAAGRPQARLDRLP